MKTARVAELYAKIERSADAKSHVFPWLPNGAVKAKNDATKELYELLSDIVETKKQKASNMQESNQTNKHTYTHMHKSK